MQAYGFDKKIITTLEEIDDNQNNFYTYKKLSFFSKLKPSNNKLLITFHGAVKGKGINRIIFRGYNWQIQNTDIVCISDYLLNVYRHYRVNWALSSEKYNANALYKELFEYFISKKQYSQVFFTGSSAGGFPSIKWASIFGKTALVSNSQIYLEKSHLFYKELPVKHNPEDENIFVSLQANAKLNMDKILYKDKILEDIVRINQPERLILFCNKLDSTYQDHILPFSNFIKENHPQIILDLNFFERILPNVKPHNLHYPENVKLLDILKKYLIP